MLMCKKMNYSHIVHKCWGHELIIVNNELYCGKILHIDKGTSLHLQYHKLKDETLYVLSGIVTMTSGEYTYRMGPGEKRRIPPLTIHKVEAKTDAEIIEISTPHYDADTYHVKAKPLS